MARIPPVIIIGMHRSGTSMLTRMLENLGLFVGHRKESNHEAVFFQELNNWLLRQAGAAWDNPEAIHYLLDDRAVRPLIREYLMLRLSSPHAASFLGLRRYLRYRSPLMLDIPWGWKDPRNTYTLPFWLDLFPDAKVINVVRHGVDVANSLKVRREKGLTRMQTRFSQVRPLYRLRPKSGGFTQSARCATLGGGFSLWEEYMREAERHVKALGARTMEVRYEELLSAPEDVLRQVAEHCSLMVSPERLRAVSGRARPERAYAFARDSRLASFATAESERLGRWGYEQRYQEDIGVTQVPGNQDNVIHQPLV